MLEHVLLDYEHTVKLHRWLETEYKLPKMQLKDWIFSLKTHECNLYIWITNFSVYKCHLLACEGFTPNPLMQLQSELARYKSPLNL